MAAITAIDDVLARGAGELTHGSLDASAALARWHAELTQLSQAEWARAAGADFRYWLDRAVAVLAHAVTQANDLAPCLAWLASAEPPWQAADATTLYRELVARMATAATPLELAAAASTFHDELPGLEQIAATDSTAPLSSFFEQLSTHLLVTQRACEAFSSRAADIARQAVELADSMDFRFLYDAQRDLFSIGYNVSGARLDGSHYDLLASEARLASLVAISKGDAPLEHWWKLGRPRTATSAGRSLLSWSGSMFEYLMPLLVTGFTPDTLLGETCRSAVGRQRDYAADLQVPWGISEAAYNVMDLAMNYQYQRVRRAGAGLQERLGRRFGDRSVRHGVASLVRLDLALANFDVLDAAGLAGKYGYYEAIDYTAWPRAAREAQRGGQGLHGPPPRHELGRARQPAVQLAHAAALLRRRARQSQRAAARRARAPSRAADLRPH